MTYDLIIGDYAYSSWSLRAWLLFEKFNIPRKLHRVSFKQGGVPEQMPQFAPAKTVPTIPTPEGAIVGESLAIAEELASRHPDLYIWPSDPKARATARSLAAEMASGFTALRSTCPMNIRASYVDMQPSEAVLADPHRLEVIWDHARSVCAPSGPWLCGDYSAANAFFAPVAARVAGFRLPLSASAQAYVDAHLNDDAFRRWRAMGLVRGETLNRYAQPYATGDWPGPAPRPARAVASGPSVNDTCPYSGDPVTDFMEMNGKIYGFCNPFCRDKTVPDPEAWPAFMALVA
jgi:glutathione S-transferase